MSFNKTEILHLSAEEKRQLAFELLDSIDEEFVQHPIPEWKKQLINERINNDMSNPEDVEKWADVRKKYFRQ